MEFLVLGPLQVREANRMLVVGGRRQRAVLARLLVARGEVVAADRLVADLWPGQNPARALGGLQAYICNLRRVLEPDRSPYTPARLLVSRPPGYLLAAPAASVDARRFETAVHAGVSALDRRRPRQAAPLLREALEQWRGPPYADLADQAWLAPELARLSELHLAAREHWARAMLALGHPTAVVAELEPLRTRAPLRESLWQTLALALYRCGRQGDALATLRTLRACLAAELGVDPIPAVQALEAALLAQDPSLDWTPPAEPIETGSESADLTAPAVPSEVPASIPVGAIGPGTDGTDSAPDPAVGSARPGPPPALASATVHPGLPGQMALVGRDEPFARLRAAAEATQEYHRRQLVVLAGEPGIGKTCLIEAFADWCRGNGWRVGWGGAHAGGGAPALWPWRRVLTELADPQLPSALRALGNGAGPTGIRSTEDADAAGARFALHAAVADHLRELAARRPVLIVLDDLQWADGGSLRLLADLAGLLGSTQVLVVVALRTGETIGHSGELAGALTETLATLAHHGGLRLNLGGLTIPAVAALTSAHLGTSEGGVDDDLADRLTRRTSGNPFLVHEVLRLMADEGPRAGLETVPAAVADVLRRRVGLLADPVGQVLTAAAVAGRAIDIDLVVAATELSEPVVSDALDAAALAGLLVETPTGLAFAHDLMREMLYAEAPPLARARLHYRVGQAIEARGPAEPAILADHYCRAGAPAADLAVRYAIAAARDARARLAYDDAAAWWGRAVQAHDRAGRTDPRRRVELLLAQAVAQADAGDAVGAYAARAAVVTAADAVADVELAARALTSVDAAVLRRRPYGEVELGLVERIETTLARLPEEDSPARARLLATLGVEYYDGTADPRCAARTGEAVAMARRLGDPRLLAVTLNARAAALRRPGHVDELAGIGAELVAVATAHRLAAAELAGRLILLAVHTQRFELAAADAVAAECDAGLRRLRLPALKLVLEGWRAGRLALAGQFRAAQRAYQACTEAQRRMGQWDIELWSAGASSLLAFQRGNLAEAAEVIEPFEPIVPWFVHDTRILAASAWQRAGQSGELTSGPWPAIPNDYTLLATAVVRAEAAIAAGNRQVREDTYQLLAPCAGQLALGEQSFLPGPVDVYLGRLAAALGEPEAARRHLDAAVADCELAGLSWWAARARAQRPRVVAATS